MEAARPLKASLYRVRRCGLLRANAGETKNFFYRYLWVRDTQI